jgi:hypothetical protein
MPNLQFSTSASHLIVSGQTFYIKEKLKLLGARWNSELTAWTVPVHLDSAYLRNDLETASQDRYKEAKAAERAESKRLREYSRTPEGIKAAKDAEKAAVLAAFQAKVHWICCADCEVVDWKRQHTYCGAHSYDGNGFRVSGRLRTGD